MEDYDMTGAADDCLLLPASPVQLMDCPIDPFLERLAAASLAAAGGDFGPTLDESGACGRIQRCLPPLPMEEGTAEDGNFEIDDDDDDDSDDDSDVDILPGEWRHGRKARELPPRPPSRAGMAGDFLIFDEQEDGGYEDLEVETAVVRAGSLERGGEGEGEGEGEAPTKRGRTRDRDALPEDAYASPPSPTPLGPRTRTRAGAHKHRGGAPRKYTSVALREGGRGTSLEIVGSQLSVFPPLPPPLLGPLPSQMTPTLREKMPKDTEGNEARWSELALDEYDIPSPPTARLSSPSTVSSHYAHSSSDKENKPHHYPSPVGGSDGDYPDADSMDISPSPSPNLPRSRASRTLSPPLVKSDSGSSIDISSPSSPSSSSPAIDTTTSSSPSSGGATSEDEDDNDDDNGPRAGPSARFHSTSHPQPRTSTSFTYPKPPSLRSIHSSAAASIKHDCTSLIKGVLLPQITSPTSTNHSSIFATSRHFQRHLRSCFSSFTGNLTTWKLALQNALHVSPPKGRITLPGYLTLVPAYPHLILELNIRLNSATTSNSTSTSTLKPPRPRLPTPPPPTPIYALSKLVLAELTIAAYLAEVEMYSRTLALPVQSKSADLVRQKLLRRVSREANDGVEEAHGMCTVMWRGEWGLGGEETDVDVEGMGEGGGEREGEGERRRRRTSGILKEYSRVLGREEERREGKREREQREREECAREFTWWWEEGRDG